MFFVGQLGDELELVPRDGALVVEGGDGYVRRAIVVRITCRRRWPMPMMSASGLARWTAQGISWCRPTHMAVLKPLPWMPPSHEHTTPATAFGGASTPGKRATVRTIKSPCVRRLRDGYEAAGEPDARLSAVEEGDGGEEARELAAVCVVLNFHSEPELAGGVNVVCVVCQSSKHLEEDDARRRDTGG